MRGQENKLYHLLLPVALLSILAAEPSYASDTDIQNFYSEWQTVQRSTIPELTSWVDQHINEDADISVKVIADLPALIDHQFRKTLKMDMKDARKHLIQWLNIHRHSQMNHSVNGIKIENDTAFIDVSYDAEGVTVLPSGRHKTMRLKTALKAECQDILNLAGDAITIIKSDCTLKATSIPLRARP